MLFETLVVFIVVLIAEILRRRWKKLQFFTERGIPGPKPHLLWGHYPQMRSDHYYWINKWSEEYGSEFGIFWGNKPFLVTRDLDIAKEVLIKQFPKFINRGKQFALEDVHPLEVFAFLDEPRWKAIRSAVTPAFSSRKIKEMTPSILRSLRDLENNLSKFSKTGGPFDVYPLLKRFTVDTIGRTIFGINAKTQVETEVTSPLLRAALVATASFMGGKMDLICNSFVTVNRVFGVIIHWLLRWHILPHAMNDIEREMTKVIKARRNAPPKQDLLQSLLESQEVSTDTSALAARGDTEDEKKSSKTVSVQLTTGQVVGSAITMFMAGYDTTSTALGYILHCLGKHPDVQRRLRAEIEEALQGEEPTYEVAMNLKYADRVIRETFRLLPPVTGLLTRRAATDVEICGKMYPAGLTFYFPTGPIHIDPEYWDAPLTFDPDRFLRPLKHPLAYQPFGDGPRNCVGMRAALLVLKLTLCKIVPKFEFEAIEDLEIKGVMIATQPKGILITAKRIQE